jgi:MFS family permease
LAVRPTIGRLLPEPGPGRLLAVTSFVASIGSGLYVAISVIYFVRIVGLQPAQVGIGLSLAGLFSVPLGVPLGHLADRYGARGATMAFTAGQGLLLVAASFVQSFPLFVLVVALVGIAEAGEAASRGALIAGVIGTDGRVRISAYLRSVYNGGFTVGLFFAGVGLAVDTRSAYQALIWVGASAALSVSLLYLRLPRVASAPAATTGRSGLAGMRDLPYLAVAQIAGLSRLGSTVLLVGLPLWIVSETSAPRVLAAWLTGVNTVLVILFQVRAARPADTLQGAARLQRVAFLTLAASCVLAGLAGYLPTWGATVLLVATTLLLTWGEMWGEGARWAMRYELAPQHAQGQYGGVFRLGQIVPAIAGPVLIISVTDRLGMLGWLVLAAVFVLGASVNRSVFDWAVRTRPASATSG